MCVCVCVCVPTICTGVYVFVHMCLCVCMNALFRIKSEFDFEEVGIHDVCVREYVCV